MKSIVELKLSIPQRPVDYFYPTQTESENNFITRLTKAQKTLIGIHSGILNGMKSLESMPIENEKTANNSGRGVQLDRNYSPSELKLGLKKKVGNFPFVLLIQRIFRHYK